MTHPITREATDFFLQEVVFMFIGKHREATDSSGHYREGFSHGINHRNLPRLAVLFNVREHEPKPNSDFFLPLWRQEFSFPHPRVYYDHRSTVAEVAVSKEAQAFI